MVSRKLSATSQDGKIKITKVHISALNCRPVLLPEHRWKEMTSSALLLTTMRRITLKISDPATAFRLSKAILATVDEICTREDLTRSQVFRRSVVQYLKNQNALITDLNAPKPQKEW